jgi:hypothetical protein
MKISNVWKVNELIDWAAIIGLRAGAGGRRLIGRRRTAGQGEDDGADDDTGDGGLLHGSSRRVVGVLGGAWGDARHTRGPIKR